MYIFYLFSTLHITSIFQIELGQREMSHLYVLWQKYPHFVKGSMYSKTFDKWWTLLLIIIHWFQFDRI